MAQQPVILSVGVEQRERPQSKDLRFPGKRRASFQVSSAAQI